MRALVRVSSLMLLLAVAAARSPVFDDDDEDSGVGRNDQHVATVPLEHSFGVRSAPYLGGGTGHGGQHCYGLCLQAPHLGTFQAREHKPACHTARAAPVADADDHWAACVMRSCARISNCTLK